MESREGKQEKRVRMERGDSRKKQMTISLFHKQGKEVHVYIVG